MQSSLPLSEGSTARRTDHVALALLAAGCLLQLVMGAALALTQLPLCDEGFYGVPAHVLSVDGALRNPVLESAGIDNLRGIDRTVFWMAPGGMVVQAGAFKLFGFGLLVQRGVSVLCGLGVVLFWYSALRNLIPDREAALAALLLPADFIFLTMSSLGRSDMISLFFAMAALAGYMYWRESKLTLAIAAASLGCAMSGIVHPNGGIASAASLAVLIWHLDRKRLKWSFPILAALCFLLVAAPWAIYIARSPDLFAAQFLGNAAGRLGRKMTLAGLMRGEVTRYLGAWGLMYASGFKWARALMPASYLASALFCTLSRELRRKSFPLLLMFAAISLTLIFLEGAKQGFYLLHLTPLFSAFLAMSVSRLWTGGIPARTLAVAQLAIVALGVSSLVPTVINGHLQQFYEPVVTFLNDQINEKNLVIAPSEFYFGLDCKTCLRDDSNLGAVSGKRPDYIVLSSDYLGSLEALRAANPSAYVSIQERLRAEYRLVLQNECYRVLQRTAAHF